MCCTCWRALFGRSVYISTITQQFISALPSTYSTEPFMSFDFSYGTHLQRHHRSFVVHCYATQNVTVTGLKPEYFSALTLLVGWRERHPVCKKKNSHQQSSKYLLWKARGQAKKWVFRKWKSRFQHECPRVMSFTQKDWHMSETHSTNVHSCDSEQMVVMPLALAELSRLRRLSTMLDICFGIRSR